MGISSSRLIFLKMNQIVDGNHQIKCCHLEPYYSERYHLLFKNLDTCMIHILTLSFKQTQQKKRIAPMTYDLTYENYSKEEVEKILRNYVQSCLNSFFLGYFCFYENNDNYSIVLHKCIEVHSIPKK
jgi:hypothetical protein